MAEVMETMRVALEAASQTPLGRRALAGHDEDFEVEVAGSEPFHVAIAGGALHVRPGRVPREEPLRFTRVQLDEPTLRAILGGALSPVEAMEQGRLFLRTRLYGGALITLLLRAAYDLARQQSLSQTGG